ncbi:hypothetical protein RRF57_001428 [Xylaria bambusicola]|uniref:NACHT domain-containing protein n=1 Tax=Xylaria bambusicola TaxID=326684 RepID=A0AAN7Z0R0_9PEZI
MTLLPAVAQPVSEFSNVLDENQRTELNRLAAVPDTDAILVFTAQLDSSSRHRRGRSFASRLHTTLLAVRNFCTVVDVFVSSHPEIAALVWGSVRLTMLVISNYTSYYEATSDLFMRIGRLCPLFDECLILYQQSRRLQERLVDFHTTIVHCCKHVVEAVRRPWREQILRTFWNSFEQEFKPDIDRIQTCSDWVKEEIALAQAQADFLEREEESNNRSTTQRLLSQINRNVTRTRHSQRQVTERKTQKRRQQLLTSLSTYDYLRFFKQSLLKQYDKTSDWIFQTPEFQGWLDGTAPLLCCFGKIGSGKTVATASVIRHILSEKGSGSDVSFFFVESGNRESLRADTIIRSILRQRLTSAHISPQIMEGLEQLDSFNGLGEYVNLLRIVMLPPTPSYIVIDGLDECEKQDRYRLLAALSQLIDSREHIRLFLSSRHSLHWEIRKTLKSYKFISMDCPSGHDAISMFINDIVRNKIDNEELRIGDPSLEEDIKLTLARGAQGMFLWVTFQLDEICAQHCDKDIRDTLDDLPKSLADIYCRVLRRIIARGHGRAAQKVFSWLSVSTRLMSLSQLREAIAIEIGQQYSKPETLYNDMENITSWCENLVQVDEEHQLVQFAHTTIMKFFIEETLDPTLTEFHIDVHEVDHDVGEKCITYLNFNDFRREVSRRAKPMVLPDSSRLIQSALGSTSKSASLLTKLRPGLASRPVDLSYLQSLTVKHSTGHRSVSLAHPFLDYASTNWILHTRTFRKEKSKTWALWERMIIDGHPMAIPLWGDNTFDANGHILDWAYDARHYALIRLINDSGQLAEHRASHIIINSVRDSEVEILGILNGLGSTSRIDTTLIAMTTVETLSIEGNKSMVGLLYDTKKVDINARDDRGMTPLSRAAAYGDGAVVRALLNNIEGLNLDAEDNEGNTPLMHAVKSGYKTITKFLLAEGFNPNARDARGQTSLHHAAVNGYETIVQILLTADSVQPNTRDHIGMTPLSCAVWFGHGNIVRLLLSDDRVDPNTLDDDGRTALWWAASNGETETVEILFAVEGTDAYLRDFSGTTPHMVASLKGHEAIVNIFERRPSQWTVVAARANRDLASSFKLDEWYRRPPQVARTAGSSVILKDS